MVGHADVQGERTLKTFTDAELDALPVAPDRYETLVDSETGHAYHVRLLQQFLVNDTDIFTFTDAGGVSWTIGRTSEGQYFKSRLYFGV